MVLNPASNLTPNNLDKANQKVVEISKRYGLNPTLLKEIMLLRNKGLNNISISEKTGINKNTVNKYVNALGEMENNDFIELLLGVAVIFGGVYLLSKLFEDD